MLKKLVITQYSDKTNEVVLKLKEFLQKKRELELSKILQDENPKKIKQKENS